MRDKISFVLGLIFLVLVGYFLYTRFSATEDSWLCENGQWVKRGNPSSPVPTGVCEEGQKIVPPLTPATTLPNPASQNCLNEGGRLQALQETAGTLGICVFPDGSECEEWQFYREECLPGQYTQADTAHPYQGVVSQGKAGYLFKSDVGAEYDLKLPDRYSLTLKERLLAEINSGQPVVIVAAESPPLSKILILRNFQEK